MQLVLKKLRKQENQTRFGLIARKLKLLLAVLGAIALVVALSRAMHSYSAQADLQNASTNEVPAPRAGQIVPSRPQGILVCSLPVSDCERTMMMIPMSLRFSPREIGEAPDSHPLVGINRTVRPVHT
jgi:hypothetical protein